MEWRRGVFGARLRVQLLLVFLLMAVAPSVLLLLVGSEVIRQTVDKWFNVDVERILASSQVLEAQLRDATTDRSRVHARAIADEIRARGLLGEGQLGRLRRTVQARGRELEIDLVNVFTADGEIVAVMDPRLPPATSWDCGLGRGPGRDRSPGPRGGGDRGLRGGRARAGGGAGAGRRRAGGGSGGGVELPVPGGGAGRPRGPRPLHQVPRDPDLSRPDPLLLPFAVRVPGAADPVRGRLARPLSRSSHHHPLAAGGPGRRADRRRAAGRPRGLPVGERGASRAHRVVQPHVGAAGADRGGGRVQPGRAPPQEPGAGGATPAHRHRPRDGGHRRPGRGPGGHPHRGQRRGPAPARAGAPPRWACRWTGCCAGRVATRSAA